MASAVEIEEGGTGEEGGKAEGGRGGARLLLHQQATAAGASAGPPPADLLWLSRSLLRRRWREDRRGRKALPRSRSLSPILRLRGR